MLLDRHQPASTGGLEDVVAAQRVDGVHVDNTHRDSAPTELPGDRDRRMDRRAGVDSRGVGSRPCRMRRPAGSRGRRGGRAVTAPAAAEDDQTRVRHRRAGRGAELRRVQRRRSRGRPPRAPCRSVGRVAEALGGDSSGTDRGQRCFRACRRADQTRQHNCPPAPAVGLGRRDLSWNSSLRTSRPCNVRAADPPAAPSRMPGWFSTARASAGPRQRVQLSRRCCSVRPVQLRRSEASRRPKHARSQGCVGRYPQLQQ